jgi:hypothetical protein
VGSKLLLFVFCVGFLDVLGAMIGVRLYHSETLKLNSFDHGRGGPFSPSCPAR